MEEGDKHNTNNAINDFVLSIMTFYSNSLLFSIALVSAKKKNKNRISCNCTFF